jgi:hypothetical protein
VKRLRLLSASRWYLTRLVLRPWSQRRHIPSIARAIAQAVSRWVPTAAARVQTRVFFMWDLRWAKWCWGRFSASTSVSPPNFYSTNCSTITIIYHRPVMAAVRSGLSLNIPPISRLTFNGLHGFPSWQPLWEPQTLQILLTLDFCRTRIRVHVLPFSR